MVVVVNQSNPISALSKAEANDIFRGRKTSWKGNVKIVPVNFKVDSIYREAFYRRVLGARSAAEEFFMPGSPNAFRTSTRTNSKSILRFVGRFDGAIAYLPKEDIDDTVKVVYTFESR